MYARRTGFRIPFRAPRGRRSYDTVVRPQALWLPAVSRSGGCRSAARSYAVPGTGDSDSPERQASGCGPWASVLGDVCASRTGVRVLSWANRGRRSHDTVVRPRAACVEAVSWNRRLSSSGSGAGCPRDESFCPVRSGGRPSRTATLRSRAMCVLAALGPGRTSVGSAISIAGNVCPSTGCVGPASRAHRLRTCATCVLAAPGSGSRLGQLDERERKTRVTGHKRCGCQPCREAGGCPPPARGLAVAGTWGSVLSGAAAVRPEQPRSYPGRRVC